jgi:hypothetical protein
VSTFRVHEDFVADMHLCAARNTLLTASGDGTLAILDLRSAQVTARSDNQEDELLSGVRPRLRGSVGRLHCKCRVARPAMIPRVCDAPERGYGRNYMLKFLRPQQR